MEHAGIRQPQMMREFGVSKTTIGRWTHDDPAAKGPSNAELHRWAELCGVPFDWLVTGAGSIEEAAPEPSAITSNRDALLRGACDAVEQAEVQARSDRRRVPRQS